MGVGLEESETHEEQKKAAAQNPEPVKLKLGIIDFFEESNVKF